MPVTDKTPRPRIGMHVNPTITTPTTRWMPRCHVRSGSAVEPRPTGVSPGRGAGQACRCVLRTSAEALAKATREVDERRGRRSWIMIFVVILLICACVVFGIHLCTFFRVGNPSDESSSEDSVDSSFSPPTPGPISHTIFPWSRPRG